MTTSTPPAWKWLDECYVPAEACDCTAQLTDAQSNAVPEHTGGVRFVRETLTELAVGAQNDNPACAVSQTVNTPDTGNIAWACTSCGEARYGKLRGVTTWHWDRCGICGRTKAVTQPRDFGGHQNPAAHLPFPEALYEEMPAMIAESAKRHADDPLDVNLHDAEPLVTVTEPPKCPVCLHEMENDEGVLCDHCEETIGVESFAVVNGPGGVSVYHLACYDEVYGGGQDADGTVKDTPPDCQACEPEPARSAIGAGPLFGAVTDSFDVPFKTQEFMFEELADAQLEYLHDLLNKHSGRILEMARRRHRTGYAVYGSAAYQWDAETRLTNVIEELADAVVYLTSGSIE